MLAQRGMTRSFALTCAFTLVFGSDPRLARAFHEDFDGPGLDATVWVAEPGNGEVVVANGVVTLSCGGSTFPVVTTREDPFPPGDFVVRVGMQYQSVDRCGDGFGSLDNFWEDYYTGTACRPFLLWQDAGGLYVYTGSAAVSANLAPAPETGYHIYEWTYMDGAYHFSMDGVLRASGGCAPRATSIFLGHPHPIGCSPWTSFAVDFIDISPLGGTPAATPTWGKLKQIYR